MPHIKTFVLFSYLLSAFFSIAGITMALLSIKKTKTKLNIATIAFLSGMLLMCFYDWFLYFSNYQFLNLSSTLTLRLGSCLISLIFYLWINMAQKISGLESCVKLKRFFMIYTLSYSAIWFICTIFLRGQFFYTIKWFLLTTDIILMVLVLVITSIFTSHAYLSERKNFVMYMVIVTSMLFWNYISFIWGETSVYWGNSRFIREPLDLTILFWLIVNGATIYFVYHLDFKTAYENSEQSDGTAVFNLENRLKNMEKEYNLTHREVEIIRLVYGGLSNNEIADRLYISSSTVKSHIYNTFRKLNVKSRSETICLIHDPNYVPSSANIDYKEEI